MSTKCCPIGSEGSLSANYSPLGHEIDLDGLPCYVVGSSTEKAIVLYYDIFGYNGGRTRLICDQLADAGYFVMLPDIMRGDAWPADKTMETLMEWLKNFPWDPLIQKDTDNVLGHIKSKDIKSIGCLGFCAGAWGVFHLCQNPIIKCGASIHPSVQIGSNFGETPEDLAELLKCPQLLYAAGNDLEIYKPGGKVYECLTKKFGNENDIREFPEMNHGFASRGDLQKSEVSRDVKLVMEGVVAFFKKHL